MFVSAPWFLLELIKHLPTLTLQANYAQLCVVKDGAGTGRPVQADADEVCIQIFVCL